MRIDIKYDGGLSVISERLANGIEEIIGAGARQVCENAKTLCPVDTGALRDSISVECGETGADIVAGTDYAAYVEFGTSKMAPQPYLVPALIESGSSVLEAMAAAIEN